MATGFPVNWCPIDRNGACGGRRVTLPRTVVPGTTYHITRRCLDRRFYLVPSEETNAIIAYALAAACEKHGVEPHGYNFECNHSHVVVTDVRGVLPDFMRDFHRAVALAIKERHGIPETMWSDACASAVELWNLAAQMEAIVYAITNPVKDHLVSRASEWPGVVSLPGRRELVAKRPDIYFSEKRPEEIRVPITAPPAWTGDEEQWHRELERLVVEEEERVAGERLREGRKVMGRERVLRQDPFDRPKSRDRLEPKRNPVFATGGDGLLMAALIYARRLKRAAYRVVRVLWNTDKMVVFPAGTWWVVRYAGASVAA